MVTIKYEGIYRNSFGATKDIFDAKTLEDVITKIEEKYAGKDYIETVRNYAMIFHNDELVCKVKKNDKHVYDLKLKKNDQLVFTLLLAGG